MCDSRVDEDAHWEGVAADQRREVAEAYDFAKFFDFYLHSDAQQMTDAVEGLYAELRRTKAANKGQARPTKRALKVVLANLLKHFAEHPELYTAYSRNHDGYPDDRYNPLKVKMLGTRRVADGLEELDHIEENIIGFQRAQFNYRRRSRMRATPDFIDRLQADYGLTPDLIEHYEQVERIILKKSDKKLIAYDETDETRSLRQHVEAYNTALLGAEITLDAIGHMLAERCFNPPDFTRKSYHRVFSRGHFDLGGRFYGPWWQTASKQLRSHILINGEPTVECDYSAHFFHILYGLRGLNYFDLHGDGDDPYEFEGDTTVCRDFRKMVALLALSGKTKRGTQTSIRNKIRKEFTHYTDPNVRTLLNGLEAKHDAIAGSFYSDLMPMLQFKDSQIAQTVIEVLLNQSIIPLCIHDSFIVQITHTEILKQVMRDAFVSNGLTSVPCIKGGEG